MRNSNRWQALAAIVLLFAACEETPIVQTDGGSATVTHFQSFRPAGWLATAGGSGDDVAWEMVVDPGGNTIVSGWFSSWARFGQAYVTSARARGLFIAKLDRGGNFLWAVPLEGLPNVIHDNHNGLGVDAAGNIYYAGAFTGTATFGSTTLTSKGDDDVFVTKLDPSGNVLWAVRAGGPLEDTTEHLAVDGAGQITICGRYDSAAEFGSTTLPRKGKMEMFVARLDSSGKFAWAVQAGGEAEGLQGEWAESVALDAAGNAYVTGSVVTHGATFGSLSLPNTERPEAFVAKLDPSGSFVWVTAVGDAMLRGHDLVVDGERNVYVAGANRSGGSVLYAMVLARLDPNGKLAWVNTYPATETSGVTGLALGKGQVILTGGFAGTFTSGPKSLTSTGAADALVLGVDPAGKVVWAEQAGGPEDDWALAAVRDRTGRLTVTGGFRSTASFGEKMLTSSGQADVFFWKLDSEPR